MAKIPEPKTNRETTGEQNILTAISYGATGILGGFPVIGGGGAGGFMGSGFGGTNFDREMGWGGWGNPFAALVGTGTFENKNKYTTPLMAGVYGGSALGVLPGTRPWSGTYGTYRIMSADPTIVLAAMSKIAPILAGEWTIEADDDAPAEAADFISDYLMPMRSRLLMEGLRALTFGNKAFELVWTTHNSYLVFKKLKPLLPELTNILVDEHGSYAGLSNLGDELDPMYSWVYTFDQDGDNYYGRGLMENCRRPWSNRLNADDNLARLGYKVSSIIPIIKHPSGEGQDGNGNTISNHTVAMRLCTAMMSGRGIAVQNLSAMQLEGVHDLIDAAKASLWDISTIDMGNPGPTIMALIEYCTTQEKLLVRGWRTPERSLIEARHGGSRADSQTHGDIGSTDCDLIQQDFIDSLNAGPVDKLLLANFGPMAVGTVRVKPTPIVDAQKILDAKILDGISGNPQLMNEFLKSIDYGQFLDRISIAPNVVIDENRGDKPLEWTGQMLPTTAAANTDRPPNAPVGKPDDSGGQNLSIARQIEVSELKSAGYTPEQMARVLSRRQHAN